jgi:hypothetical protein
LIMDEPHGLKGERNLVQPRQQKFCKYTGSNRLAIAECTVLVYCDQCTYLKEFILSPTYVSPNEKSLGSYVPWMMRPLDYVFLNDVSLGRCVSLTKVMADVSRPFGKD